MQVGREDPRFGGGAREATAPAPSPNRMAVPRSFGLVILESESAPTTTASFASPARMNLSAIDSAYRKLQQAASTPSAGLPKFPRRACSITPALGNIRSGVQVPTTIRSTSVARASSRFQCRARRVLSHVDGGLARGRNVAALDAGALADPRIGGIQALLKVDVAEDGCRQVAAGAEDSGAHGRCDSRRPWPNGTQASSSAATLSITRRPR